MCPLIVAVAASVLLVAGPASAQTSDPPPGDTTTTAPTTTTTTTSPPTTTTSSSSSKPVGPPPPHGNPPDQGSGGRGPAGPPPNRPGRSPGDKDCDDFATQKDAQQYFESVGGSATNDADRLDENHNGIACESLADDGDNQDAAVTATGDDGSRATTSGDQVTEVPEGSAQTGGN